MAELIHATAIAMNGKAALIRGRSGSGKSDLALRCLTFAPTPLIPGRVELVSDDQVLVESRADGMLWASAPETIKGKLEVRGLGIIDVTPASTTRITLIVDLVQTGEIERLPQQNASVALLGVAVPLLKFNPLEASTPAKLLLALEKSGRG